MCCESNQKLLASRLSWRHLCFDDFIVFGFIHICSDKLKLFGHLNEIRHWIECDCQGGYMHSKFIKHANTRKLHKF